MSPRSSKPKKTKTEKKTSGKKSSGNQPAVDVYTGLLFAGFLALVTGCALLAVELSKYKWEMGT
jgi:hypothetical protein